MIDFNSTKTSANKKLPSLRGLQIFESAARHMSLKQAAEELCLSPSAVSRQIQTLEDYLGTVLFNRSHRKISLTATGDKLASDVEEIFALVNKSLEGLRVDRNRLRLSVAAHFAAKMLMPRMPAFEMQNRAVAVDFLANHPAGNDPAPVINGEADACIIHGMSGQWGELAQQRLTPPFEFMLVGSKSLIQGPVADIEQICELPWLWNDFTPWLWPWFLEQLNCGQFAGKCDHHYNSWPLYIQAVVQGRGIAILPKLDMSVDGVEKDQLVQVTPATFKHQDYGYYLLWDKNKEPKFALARFIEWVCGKER